MRYVAEAVMSHKYYKPKMSLTNIIQNSLIVSILKSVQEIIIMDHKQKLNCHYYVIFYVQRS